LILAGAALLLIFIASFRVADLSYDSNAICFFLFILIEACALYLIMQRKPLHRIVAGVLFFVGSFFLANHTVQTLFAWNAASRRSIKESGYQIFALFQDDALLHYLLPPLLLSLIIGGAGLLVSSLIKKDSTARRMILAGAGAGVLLVIQPLMYLALDFDNYDLIIGFLCCIPYALAFFLAFLLVGAICRIKGYGIRSTAGRTVWFWVCAVFAIVSLVVQANRALSGDLDPLGFLPVILAVISILGYLMLIGSRRMGYIVVVLAVGVSFFGTFSNALTLLLEVLDAPVGSYVSYTSIENAVLPLRSALLMLVNPALTGLALVGVWNQVPAAAPYQRPKVSPLFEVTAVCSLALGIFVALVSAPGVFNFIWVPSGGYEGPTTFFTLGLICASVGLFATLECFNPRAKVRKPLLATSVITTLVSSLVAIPSLVSLFLPL
jgi:hypothetical protein